MLTSGISAEYGRFSGGVINAITKSGGNTFSGSFRTNFTNASWSKVTPFEASRNITNPNSLQESSEGVLGGPIVRDRLWFFTSGRYAPLDLPKTIAQSGVQVMIITDRSSAVPESLVSAMLEETGMIWKPIGVKVRNGGGDVLPWTSIVRVIVTDDPIDGSSTDERLGWIRFVTPNQPEPIIYLSRFAARQLLDAVATVRTRPATYREVLLSRIMGRALAHELGHYLFASMAHSSHGLIRGSWPLDLLIANDRAAFRLAETHAVNGERRSYALLRPIGDVTSDYHLGELILDAYTKFEAHAHVA